MTRNTTYSQDIVYWKADIIYDIAALLKETGSCPAHLLQLNDIVWNRGSESANYLAVTILYRKYGRVVSLVRGSLRGFVELSAQLALFLPFLGALDASLLSTCNDNYMQMQIGFDSKTFVVSQSLSSMVDTNPHFYPGPYDTVCPSYSN